MGWDRRTKGNNWRFKQSILAYLGRARPITSSREPSVYIVFLNIWRKNHTVSLRRGLIPGF